VAVGVEPRQTAEAPRPATRGEGIDQAGQQRSARIESLRAIAALGVLLGHAHGLANAYHPTIYDSYLDRVITGGGFGVFLFFGLSGYLLYWPFARRDFGGGGAVQLRRYATNRALRILPLYWLSVVVVLLVQEEGGTAEQWWRFMLLMENFSTSTVGQVNGVLWSLVVEIHFYVLLPLLALGISRAAAGSLKRAAAAIAALGAGSLGLWLAFVTFGSPPNPLWRYNIPATFFYFVGGMLLVLVRIEWERRPPRWLAGPFGAGDVWLLAGAALTAVVFWRYDLGPLFAVISFLVVGACVLPLRAGRLVRMLDWRPLAAIGVASYSLYVWHDRVIDNGLRRGLLPESTAPLLLVALPLCIGIALVSYRLVEAPFLRLRRRWSPDSARTTGSGR
jgi:peptidoglycan/LPS O-acetylase OafA/YrhL